MSNEGIGINDLNSDGTINLDKVIKEEESQVDGRLDIKQIIESKRPLFMNENGTINMEAMDKEYSAQKQHMGENTFLREKLDKKEPILMTSEGIIDVDRTKEMSLNKKIESIKLLITEYENLLKEEKALDNRKKEIQQNKQEFEERINSIKL